MTHEERLRTEMLLGAKAMEQLKHSHVAVFGVGGVGGFAVEALARAGVGRLTIVDHDKISPSNLNRQVIALHSTIGRQKVEVMKERILDIDPQIEVFAHPCFYETATADSFELNTYDYIVDAVDTVTAKLLLVERAKAAGTPIISSMGTGNKLDPSRFHIADIAETSICPLARIMRKELRARDIKSLTVLYSDEPPREPLIAVKPDPGRRAVPGSVSFVPSSAGLLLAGKVIRDLTGV